MTDYSIISRDYLYLDLRDELKALGAAEVMAQASTQVQPCVAGIDLAGDRLRTDAADRVVDLHALRNSFLTLRANSGVHPEIAQDLARRSDVNLTLSRYSHTVWTLRSMFHAGVAERQTQWIQNPPLARA